MEVILLERVEKLGAIGKPAVPGLIECLYDPREHVRWEAAKTLSAIADPLTASALVTALEDEHEDVRWVSGEALVNAFLNTGPLPPTVVISAAAERALHDAALRLKACSALRKPFGTDGLLSAVADAVRPRVAARSLEAGEVRVRTPSG